VAHVVVDAVADADLHVIAGACRDMPLLTGGSAVAMPLPHLLMGEDGTSSADGVGGRDIAAPGIVLSGSCSAMTRAQVAAYVAVRRTTGWTLSRWPNMARMPRMTG
jgi:uncharacterized protein YgbK (DUF1537 family)